MGIGNVLSLINNAQLNDIANLATGATVANTYTLDLAKAKVKNFKITSADANAKSIALSNIDTTAPLITISVLLVCTTACAITHPVGTTFAGGTPTFTTGQSYWVSYDSIDGGTTWAGYSVRRA